jgi:hypothetical protein
MTHRGCGEPICTRMIAEASWHDYKLLIDASNISHAEALYNCPGLQRRAIIGALR